MRHVHPGNDMAPLFIIPPPSTVQASADLHAQVFTRDRYTCVYCGASGVPLQLDHVRPKAHHTATARASRVNDPRNLVTSCESCNAAKGAQNVQSFAAMLRGRGIAPAVVRAMLARVRAATRRRLPPPPVP